MKNMHLISDTQRSALRRLNVNVSSDMVSDAVTLLIDGLKPVISDISDIYTLDQLLEIYDAMYGRAPVIPESQRKRRFEREVEIISAPVAEHSSNRRKIRIDLTVDMSFATPFLEHIVRFDAITISEIKTGLAIKHIHQGYSSNIINYNELRTINGTLYGNLYFNMIRTEEQWADLSIEREKNWFRGYARLTKVCVYDAIQYLHEANIDYLKSLSFKSNKRRLRNTQKLLRTA